MNLRDIQEQFKSHISRNDGSIDVVSEFENVFQDSSINVYERLGIYKNNLNVSLQNVLFSRHEILKTLVGEDFLQGIVREYVRHNLPEHGNLNEYGFDLPSFIDNFPPAKGLPYLGDVARLECAWWRSYYAKDQAPLDPGELTQLPPEQQTKIKFDLHPSVGLIRSDYPIFSIRNLCLEDDESSNEEMISNTITPNAAADPDAENMFETKQQSTKKAQDASLDIFGGGEFGMTCRPYLKTHCIQLGEAHLKFLVYLRQGHTIGEATGKILAKFKDFNLIQTLQLELKRGLFVGYHIAEN